MIIVEVGCIIHIVNSFIGKHEIIYICYVLWNLIARNASNCVEVNEIDFRILLLEGY